MRQKFRWRGENVAVGMAMKHQLAGCHLVSVLKHFIGGAFKSLCIPVDEAFQPAVRLDSRKIQNYPFTTATSASDCGERAKHREREREREKKKRCRDFCI